MVDNHIVIAGGDNYNTLGMIRTLGEAGYDFEVVIIRGSNNMCLKSKYTKNKTRNIVDTEEEVVEYLKNRKCAFQGKAFLLVEGDTLTGVLDLNYNALCDKYIWNNACEEGRLTKFLNKHEQVEIAKKAGINILPSVVVNVGEIPTDIEYPIITKAITSEIEHWKDEVFVCNSEKELRAAFGKIKSSKIILQKYIKKSNEFCFDGFSINEGRNQFVSIFSKYNYLLEDRYSYYLTVENANDAKIIQEITNFCSLIKYNGIYAFEYIVDENGKLYFMENNFRNSGWSYASTCAGMPLPILWMEAMKTGCIDDEWMKQIKPGFTFMNETADFRTRVVGRMVSPLKWMKEFINCDCKLLLGKKDSAPFWSFVFKHFSKV